MHTHLNPHTRSHFDTRGAQIAHTLSHTCTHLVQGSQRAVCQGESCYNSFNPALRCGSPLSSEMSGNAALLGRAHGEKRARLSESTLLSMRPAFPPLQTEQSPLTTAASVHGHTLSHVLTKLHTTNAGRLLDVHVHNHKCFSGLVLLPLRDGEMVCRLRIWLEEGVSLLDEHTL